MSCLKALLVCGDVWIFFFFQVLIVEFVVAVNASVNQSIMALTVTRRTVHTFLQKPNARKMRIRWGSFFAVIPSLIVKRPASYFRCSFVVVSFQEICGGSERGECKPDDENCYKCVCKSAYDGTYCEKCPVSGVMTFFSHCYSIIHWTWLGGRCHSLQNPSPKEQLKIYAM